MQQKTNDQLYLPMAQLNAYAYCPRRFYYEFVLGEMVINEHVLAGQHLHERVDQFGTETREERVQIRHLYLCATRIGVIGYCDLVEVQQSAVPGQNGEERQVMYPVEYKKGKMGKWISDHAQLCVQALALEEVMGLPEGQIEYGYIFYVGSARRDKVPIDDQLRQRTHTALIEARRLAAEKSPPPPLRNWKKCRDCSLEPICLPREVIKLQRNPAGM